MNFTPAIASTGQWLGALAAAGAAAAVFGVYVNASAQRLRLTDQHPDADTQSLYREPPQTLSQRARLAVTALGKWIAPLARSLNNKSIAKNLDWAGWSITPETLIAIQVVCAGSGLALGLFFGFLSGHVPISMILAMVGTLLGWIAPGELLEGAYRRARAAVGQQALGFGDFLCAALGAGLSLENALIRLGQEMPGRLPAAMARAAQMSQRQTESMDFALDNVVREADDANVTAIVGAINQARAVGGDLAGPLSAMVATLRQQRQQRLRTAAKKRAATSFLPMIGVLLPGILIPIGFIVWQAFHSAGF